MYRITILLSIWLLPVTLAAAAESAPLFSSNETLELTLNGPFRQIDRDRDRDEEYDGNLTYVGPDGQPVELEATFEVRGNYRLRRDVCRFSQLWVDLRRGQVPGTLFEDQNRLKLVVQCRPSDRYADLVVKEYLAYRIFSRLTEPGFDVRLVNVTYNDTDRDDSRTHMGLFIEHRDTVAERFEVEGVEENTVAIEALDPHQATLVAMFMMMIGNTDFSLRTGPEGDECCHNAKLLRSQGQYLPIPYDFDSSGFVDASYAAEPNPSFGIRNNRQRLFRGYCHHNDQVADVIPVFQEAREDILALAGDPRLSSEREAEDAREYIEDFYAIIDDPGEVEDEILEDCRG